MTTATHAAESAGRDDRGCHDHCGPSSTKNKQGERDPDMHQTKKGIRYDFGMKAHIGVDDDSGLVHHVECTAAT
ncbi:hypothetical protein DXO012_12175 [Xanthomonas oryzae pv. oryzae]|nr:hypothetical protein BXO2_06575 [Xanthomonas oryzae pv. oryzae]OLH11517.1 hypothetical protein BXO559_05525 [Xanthomonas oryzae pv. oryzae]OLH19538.1 hypothetical protein DXO012_12175 [Xanthomonas oryzae pv. oryzae]OLH46932.1 hypothetical protein DXO122_10990 [Xanthomonas oryzae pv. oryzae]